jgi:nucleotidyltransferase substrate binding protein (TIGR01987 family)
MQKQDVRWKLRLENLTKAFVRLESACSQEKYSDLELAGLVQTFQLTFELCWKTLKDLLLFEGYEVNSPRETIKKAFELSLIGDTERWFSALENRNVLCHVYDEPMATQAMHEIKETFEPMLRECVNSLCQRAEQKWTMA